MDDFKVRYQGFKPTEFTQAYFNEVLQRLHEEAPASSYLKATISKTRDQFKAVVQINSAAGHFFTVASGAKITDLGHQVISKMHRQIDRWKSLRRTHETLRDPLLWETHSANEPEVSYEKKIG